MADTQRCLSQAEAIREALAQAMAADPRVILLGEGVPDPKHISAPPLVSRNSSAPNGCSTPP